jgi:pilus assembly protein CpaB
MRLLGRPLDALARRPALIGAVLALLVGVAAYVHLEDRPAAGAPVVEDIERALVVVARRDVPARATFAREDLELRSLPVEAIHPAALRSLDGAVGAFSTGEIAAGEQVLARDVATANTGGGLARLLSPGRRAFSIAVSDAMAAGGFIAPGDRVDVMALFDAGRGGRSGSAIVVENVEIIAVSALVLGSEPPEPDPRAGSSNPRQVGTTITFAVTPLEAQRIAVAEEFGTLRLVLRSPDDSSSAGPASVDLSAVAGR